MLRGPARRMSRSVRESESDAEGGKRKFGGRGALCRALWSAARRRRDLEFWDFVLGYVSDMLCG